MDKRPPTVDGKFCHFPLPDVKHRFHCISLLKMLTLFYSTAVLATTDFRSLYTRVPGRYLSAIPEKVINDVTISVCARSCARETEFECQSFDIDNRKRECHLHSHTHRNPGIVLEYAPDMDHYRSMSCTKHNKSSIIKSI